MVSVIPFIGTRYNTQLIQDLKMVLAPPYDSIPKEEQKIYYQAHNNNIIRVILGVSKPTDDEYNNKYTRSANYLQSWKRDGILVDDDKKSFYIYEQTFTLPNGVQKVRTGLFGLIKLEDYSSGNIVKNEQTSSKNKADRLKLIRATKSNLNPAFLLYSDSDNTIEKLLKEKMSLKSWVDVTDFGNVRHRLWVVNKKDFISKITSHFENKKVFITEGQNLFETALLYQKEMREATGLNDGNQPFDYIMVYLTSFEDNGLVILPTHRILTNEIDCNADLKELLDDLKENFNVESLDIDLNNLDDSTQKIMSKLNEKGKISASFAMILPKGKAFLLSLKQNVSPIELIDKQTPDEVKKLDISILHDHIISQVWIGNPEYEIEEDDIKYFRDPKSCISVVQNKKACVAFLINPTKLEQVKKIALKGYQMPPKSFMFFPRLISGILMRDMTNKWK